MLWGVDGAENLHCDGVLTRFTSGVESFTTLSERTAAEGDALRLFAGETSVLVVLDSVIFAWITGVTILCGKFFLKYFWIQYCFFYRLLTGNKLGVLIDCSSKSLLIPGIPWFQLSLIFEIPSAIFVDLYLTFSLAS